MAEPGRSVCGRRFLCYADASDEAWYCRDGAVYYKRANFPGAVLRPVLFKTWEDLREIAKCILIDF